MQIRHPREHQMYRGRGSQVDHVVRGEVDFARDLAVPREALGSVVEIHNVRDFFIESSGNALDDFDVCFVGSSARRRAIMILIRM